MSTEPKKLKRYSLSFQQMIVRQVEEEGCSIGVLQRRYGIKGAATIQRWIRRFGKTHLLHQIIRVETMEEKDELKSLQDEVKRLKLALADSMLAQRCLEVVIDQANKIYQTDLKKTLATHHRRTPGRAPSKATVFLL